MEDVEVRGGVCVRGVRDGVGRGRGYPRRRVFGSPNKVQKGNGHDKGLDDRHQGPSHTGVGIPFASRDWGGPRNPGEGDVFQPFSAVHLLDSSRPPESLGAGPPPQTRDAPAPVSTPVPAPAGRDN